MIIRLAWPAAFSAIVLLTAGAQGLCAGDAGARVEYVGGTLANLQPKTGGKVHTTDRDMLAFVAGRANVRVSYGEINLVEYGQQASRRYVMALVISPILLLSKARKHFLTLGYKDTEGNQQAMVFRVDKNDVRALLASLEARTGLKVAYQDDEARKAGGG